MFSSVLPLCDWSAGESVVEMVSGAGVDTVKHTRIWHMITKCYYKHLIKYRCVYLNIQNIYLKHIFLYCEILYMQTGNRKLKKIFKYTLRT